MNKNVQILFTAAFTTSFIREDHVFLQSRYSVKDIISYGLSTFGTLFTSLSGTDITFSWFASIYSSYLVLLTKFFKKKSIIILGGADVANIPELNYGVWRSWWRSKIVRYGIMNADLVLAVDGSLKNDAMHLARYNGNNIHVVPTGYDSDRWKPGVTKGSSVLTVAHCENLTRAKVKGIDFLCAVANAMPDQHFVLIGLNEEIASHFNIPTNLRYRESIPQNELLEHYQNAAVYFQPSLREGLPNTVCEAMLCECFPVGTNIGGIPTAIGECGRLVSYGNVDEATSAIRYGVRHHNNSAARERIEQNFSKSKRQDQLTHFIELLIDAK